VRGVLLGVKEQVATADSDMSDKEGDEGAIPSPVIRITDSIPAIHNCLITPPLEVLFIHLDNYCREEGVEIVGVYYCNQLLGDSHFDDLWAKVASDKLQSPVVIRIDSRRLSINADSSCLQLYCHNDGKWKAHQRLQVEKEEDTCAATSLAIESKWHRDLFDFENHLDQPHVADFYNVELGLKIKAPL